MTVSSVSKSKEHAAPQSISLPVLAMVPAPAPEGTAFSVVTFAVKTAPALIASRPVVPCS